MLVATLWEWAAAAVAQDSPVLPGQEGATDPPGLSQPHNVSAPGPHTSECDGWCVIRRQQQAGDGQSFSQPWVGCWLLFAREGHELGAAFLQLSDQPPKITDVTA